MHHDADPAAASRAATVLASRPMSAGVGALAGEPARMEVPLELVGFRAVAGADDLRRIAHLRDEIALPAHVRAAPAFTRLEKKETSWGWSAPSSAWER